MAQDEYTPEAAMSDVDPVVRARQVAQRLMESGAIGKLTSLAARALEETASQ
jgi:hypothetical protein